MTRLIDTFTVLDGQMAVVRAHPDRVGTPLQAIMSLMCIIRLWERVRVRV